MKAFFKNFAENITGIFLIIITVLIFLDVLARSAIGFSSAGIEELCIILFIYTIFFGTAVATRDEKHLSVDSIYRLLPAKAQFVTSLLGELLSLIFFTVLTFSGAKLVIIQCRFTSPAFEVPVSFFSWPLPVCSALMVIYTVMNIRKKWRSWRNRI